MCDGQLTDCKKSGKAEEDLVAHSVALEEDKEDVAKHLHNIKDYV